MASKRTLDSFFHPQPTKKPRSEPSLPPSSHPTYPFSINQLPPDISDALEFVPESEGRAIDIQPDLDLMYYQPYIPKSVTKDLFQFLRDELPFYRVQYKIKRGSIDTDIHTPRFTTVFGVDQTAYFTSDGHLLDTASQKPVPKNRYKCQPRPIPACLDRLRVLTENTTGEQFNFCLVNYYSSGNDSISYHSDDERFLGPNPAIASFSLGVQRDFLMKHKPSADSSVQGTGSDAKPQKFLLSSGDMILMRGPTQSNWLHSVPKRKDPRLESGRINITFRKAVVPGGTENYYRYNVGGGGVFRWNRAASKMDPWVPG
jgi:alkylated DNA repair dioxygenase AlkB